MAKQQNKKLSLAGIIFRKLSYSGAKKCFTYYEKLPLQPGYIVPPRLPKAEKTTEDIMDQVLVVYNGRLLTAVKAYTR